GRAAVRAGRPPLRRLAGAAAAQQRGAGCAGGRPGVAALPAGVAVWGGGKGGARGWRGPARARGPAEGGGGAAARGGQSGGGGGELAGGARGEESEVVGGGVQVADGLVLAWALALQATGERDPA